jgi:hypothetical protein
MPPVAELAGLCRGYFIKCARAAQSILVFGIACAAPPAILAAAETSAPAPASADRERCGITLKPVDGLAPQKQAIQLEPISSQ